MNQFTHSLEYFSLFKAISCHHMVDTTKRLDPDIHNFDHVFS